MRSARVLDVPQPPLGVLFYFSSCFYVFLSCRGLGFEVSAQNCRFQHAFPEAQSTNIEAQPLNLEAQTCNLKAQAPNLEAQAPQPQNFEAQPQNLEAQPPSLEDSKESESVPR